jgi:hypothetical protein
MYDITDNQNAEQPQPDTVKKVETQDFASLQYCQALSNDNSSQGFDQKPTTMDFLPFPFAYPSRSSRLFLSVTSVTSVAKSTLW